MLLDDCVECVGVKFVDVDLFGFLVCVIVGKKVDEGIVEVKVCVIGEFEEVKVEEF